MAQAEFRTELDLDAGRRWSTLGGPDTRTGASLGIPRVILTGRTPSGGLEHTLNAKQHGRVAPEVSEYCSHSYRDAYFVRRHIRRLYCHITCAPMHFHYTVNPSRNLA